MENEFIDYALTKIRYLINEKGYVQIKDLDFIENFYLVWLIESKYIILNCCNSDSVNFLNLDKEAFVELTELSLLRLFINDNKEDYKRFFTLIKIHGYTDNDLYNYLLTQDYNKDINIIFNLSNFVCYVLEMEQEKNTPKKILYL